MSGHAESVAERLSQAASPSSMPEWQKSDGYFITTCRVSKDDVPGLIDVACKWGDPDWFGEDLEIEGAKYDTEMLPITAWRTLADFRSSESVQPLIDMLCEICEYDEGACDDWACDDLPHVFGKIGEPAVEPLLRLAADSNRRQYVGSIAIEGLQKVVEYHDRTRREIAPCLVKFMADAVPDEIDFNTALLVALVELGIGEAAEVIERAFANNLVDVGMLGDWEMVRRDLGVAGLGLEMPKNPHSSIDRLRKQMGIGIFSTEQMFDFESGEPDPEVEQQYFERAWNLFSKSEEAQQVVKRFGDLHWTRRLLEFGINYLGETVDLMSLASVREFLLSHIPRKVSIAPDGAESIVFEITKFWEYVNRVFELPEAKAIVEWLQSDDLRAALETELADSGNWGMAKSMFMAGTEAGYDMTTPAGISQFTAAHNQMLEPAIEPTNTPYVHERQRVGRNDPCPCGSGKKFKKCCR